MKTIEPGKVMGILLIFLLSFQVNAQARKVNKLLDNSEDRAFMMQKISADKNLRTEMIHYLSQNVDAVSDLKSQFGTKPNMKMMMAKMKKDSINKNTDTTKMKMCPMCKKKMEQKKTDAD